MTQEEKNTLKKRLSRILHRIAEKLEKEPSVDSQNPSEAPITVPNKSVSSSSVQMVREQTTRRRKREKTVSHSTKSPVVNYIPQIYNQSVNLFQALHHKPYFWLWAGLGLGVSSSAIALGLGTYYLETTVNYSAEAVLSYAPEGTILIKGADGEILQAIGDVTYDPLKIWQIPEPILKAFIASEDRRFQDHKGVDFQGILRAAWSNVRARSVVEGGSTITQQVARIVFLSQERSVTRKLKEMRLAQKIEQTLTKAEILERYLNLVYLGSGAYGLGDAAWVYFGKTADQLTIAEAAMLAGIIPAPSLYSPLENPQSAKERRDVVINQMLSQGLINAQQAQEAIASPLQLNPQQPKRLVRHAPHFTDYVIKEVGKYVSRDVLKQGGVVIETTLNPKWQKEAESTLENAVKRYGRGYRFQQASLVSIDPRTGQIKAMVGGVDFANHQFNRATQAKRQPGSTFKTFVYGTAIAAGFSPNQSFLDAEYIVDGYQPGNYGDQYSGKYVSMRQALASSLNVVAVKTLVDVGWNPVIQVAKKMGIESELQPTYSLALGAWEVNLLELTSAYGTLANQGIHQNAYGISRVLDRQGDVLYQAKPVSTPALDSESSTITTWMLQDVINSGTGIPAQIGRPVAGKTGTSDQARDLWFVGYIPQLVTGIWLGNDDNSPTNGSSSISAMLWRQYMLDVAKDVPIESFPSLPKPLEGRTPTIKKEPINPKRAYYNLKPENRATSNPNRSTSRRSTRRRSTSTETQPPISPPQTVRRTSPSPVTQPSPTQRQPLSPPTVPSSTVNSAPPAPPAARKTDEN